MSPFNPWKALQGLVAGQPLQVGDVIDVVGTLATIEVPGGGLAQARGEAPSIGQRVYFRNGVIEGEAPDLPVEVIEI